MTQPQLALMDADPSHTNDKAAVLEAVATAARIHGNLLSSNEIRPYIPAHVYPKVIGATISGLVAKRILTAEGPPVRSADTAGANAGRWIPRYRCDLPALAALIAEGDS